MRCSARPIVPRGAHATIEKGVGPRRATKFLAQARSRSRGQRREPGARRANAHRRHKRSSKRRASVTTRPAQSCTPRRRGSRSTRRGRRRLEQRWRVPTVCGPCSTTAFHGTVEVGLELTRVHLALGEAARRPHRFRRDRARARAPPRPGLSGRGGPRASRAPGGDLRAGRCLGDEPDRCRAAAASLPRHPSHGPQIATRLFISRNTVKTEAVSIYRKLGASSRSEAIERAVEVGLLESSLYPPQANLTQEV